MPEILPVHGETDGAIVRMPRHQSVATSQGLRARKSQILTPVQLHGKAGFSLSRASRTFLIGNERSH